MLQPEVSVFSLSEQKVLWACQESLIFTPLCIWRLVICELSPHSFSGLTQPQAGSPVPRSWLGTCHCHLAGIKHLILQLLRFMRLQPCSYLWLTASKPPVKYFHHYWSDKSCKSKAQFPILLYPSSFWDVHVVQKQRGTDTFVSHFPKGYSIAIIWGKR